MNALQFFDAFPLVVKHVGWAREPIGLGPITSRSSLVHAVSVRHGEKVAAEAGAHFDAILSGTQTAGPR